MEKEKIDVTLSQVSVTETIRELSKEKKIKKPEDLLELRKILFNKIKFRPVDENEKDIRWKRTADQILQNGYVYAFKACTDLVIVFIALCNAQNLENRFVRLKKKHQTHSLLEVKINNDWYVFDLAVEPPILNKGEITTSNPYNNYTLVGKGKDAWSLGLTDYSKMEKDQ